MFRELLLFAFIDVPLSGTLVSLRRRRVRFLIESLSVLCVRGRPLRVPSERNREGSVSVPNLHHLETSLEQFSMPRVLFCSNLKRHNSIQPACDCVIELPCRDKRDANCKLGKTLKKRPHIHSFLTVHAARRRNNIYKKLNISNPNLSIEH